jgi:NitT/TauT family transport system substrate-binding protein
MVGWFVLVAALLIAAGVWKAIQLRSPAQEPLRVALNPWPGYEFASLAVANGYFEAEGVETRLVELSSLGDCRRAFERGQVDGFFGTLIEVVQAEEHLQRKAEVVCVVDYSDGADCILARQPIRSVAELRGKRVAIESGSVHVLVLARALELSGLKWGDVTIVHIAALQMPAAIAAGNVDAVVTYPPMSIEISRAGDCSQIFASSQIPGEIVDVLAFDAQVLKERRREVDAFVRGFFRARAYAQANQSHAYAIMAARQRVTPAEFEQAITDGIRMIGRERQQEFLGPSESLAATVEATRRILFAAGQMRPDEIQRQADAAMPRGAD